MTVRLLAAVLAVVTTGASCSGVKSQAGPTSAAVSADKPLLAPCAVAGLPGRVSAERYEFRRAGHVAEAGILILRW